MRSERDCKLFKLLTPERFTINLSLRISQRQLVSLIERRFFLEQQIKPPYLGPAGNLNTNLSLRICLPKKGGQIIIFKKAEILLADDGTRTRNIELGRIALYQLSYIRLYLKIPIYICVYFIL